MRRPTVQPHRWFLTVVISMLLLCSALLGISWRVLNYYQDRAWQNNATFIVLSGADLTLSVYDPVKAVIRTYLLPKEAYMTVSGGYGLYKLKDIVELSHVERKDESLAVESIITTFGIPIDATVDTLSIGDQLLIWRANKSYEKLAPVTLYDQVIFTTTVRPDGVTIDVVNENLFDQYFKQQLWEKRITDENLTVGVFNASDIPGYATSTSRVLERIGIRVIAVENAPESDYLRPCEIRRNATAALSYTYIRIKDILGCSLNNLDPESRYDIMVTLRGE